MKLSWRGAALVAVVLPAMAVLSACDSSAEAPEEGVPVVTQTTTPTATVTAVETGTGTPTATPSVVATPEPAFDDRSDPISTLASYYNAIDRIEFDRAAAYLPGDPVASAKALTEQFGAASRVFVVVVPPAREVDTGARVPGIVVQVTGDEVVYLASCFDLLRGIGPETGEVSWAVGDADLKPLDQPTIRPLESICGAVLDEPFNDTTTAVNVLASVVDAVNRKDFERAYGYWDPPPDEQDLDAYIESQKETDRIIVTVRPPMATERTAEGQEIARIPTILVITRTNGNVERFAGCYVAARPADAPGALWHLTDRSIFESEGSDPKRLGGSCAGE